MTPPTLTPAEREAFARDGYIGPFRAFDRAEMGQAARIIDARVLTTPSPHSVVHRTRHLDSRTVFGLSSTAAIVGRVTALLGPDLMLWGTHLFDKPPAPPDRPDEFPWHQDWYTWQLDPMITVSAWLAVTPATRENGCLEVIPGSHQRRVPFQATTNARYSITFGGKRADPACFDETRRVALPMDAGEFILFNEQLLHHSGPNRTRTRRLGLGIRLAPPFVRVHEPVPCLMVRGRDSSGPNRFVDPPASEPDESQWWTGLPGGDAVSFDGPVPGLGWYAPETDGTRTFRWSGPERESWVDLRPAAPGSLRLRSTIAHVLDPRCLEGLRIRANDRALPFRIEEDGRGVRLDARVPSSTWGNRRHRVRVSFEVPRVVRPCDADPASPDTRPLGIAVTRVELTSP